MHFQSFLEHPRLWPFFFAAQVFGSIFFPFPKGFPPIPLLLRCDSLFFFPPDVPSSRCLLVSCFRCFPPWPVLSSKTIVPPPFRLPAPLMCFFPCGFLSFFTFFFNFYVIPSTGPFPFDHFLFAFVTFFDFPPSWWSRFVPIPVFPFFSPAALFSKLTVPSSLQFPQTVLPAFAFEKQT